MTEAFEEFSFPVPYGKVCGKWWGSRAVQPILGLHGYQDNAGTFDALAPLLVERGLSLLCIDFPGHGLSSHLPQGCLYSLWEFVHVIRRLVRYHSWGPITILAHSMGGGVAYLYASIFPNDVVKYCAIDISAPGFPLSPTSMADNLDRYLDTDLSDKDVREPCLQYEHMIEISMEFNNTEFTLSKKGWEILMRRGMRPSTTKAGHYVFNRDWKLKYIKFGTMMGEDSERYADWVTCEVMNIRASDGWKFDERLYNKALDRLERHAKRVERFVVKGCHHVHLEDPDSVLDMIHRFLSS